MPSIQPIPRNQILCVSAEAVYGTGDAGFLAAPGDFAQLVHDVRFQPGVLRYERPIQTGSNNRSLAAIKSYNGARVTGWLEMRARGEAVAAGKRGMLDPWLRACGMARGAFAGGWPYTRATADGESISLIWDSAGAIHTALGGRGNLRFVYQPGQVVRVEFDVQFASLAIASAGTGILTVPVYANALKEYMDVVPGLCKNLNVWPEALAEYAQLRSLTVDLRSQATSVPVASFAQPSITRILGCGPSSDQGVGLTFESETFALAGTEADRLADFLLSGSTSGVGSITITDASGNDVVVAFAKPEFVGVTRTTSGELIVEQVEARVFGATTIAINP
jgi:hypothetical protein